MNLADALGLELGFGHGVAGEAHVVLGLLDQESMAIRQVLAAFVLVPRDIRAEVLVAEAAGFVWILDLHRKTSLSVCAEDTLKMTVDQAVL
jgi:hypothetical protein